MPLLYVEGNPRRLFLIDGLGALLSTILLHVVAFFEEVFGMPANILYRMALLTTLFAAYSLGIYMVKPVNWQRFLVPIAIANLLYCLLTVAILFRYFQEVTPLGIAYFLLEILVIFFLVRLEFRLAYAKKHK